MIYLHNITVFSKTNYEHLDHLKQLFLKCRKFAISLNPKKTLFGLEEGKLLGHIISKEGIRTDPTNIDIILNISPPRNVK